MLVVPHKQTLYINADIILSKNHHVVLADEPSIAKVNRLLRRECLKIFYNQNTFHAHTWLIPRFTKWLLVVGEERWRSIETGSLTITTSIDESMLRGIWAEAGTELLEQGLRSSLKEGCCDMDEGCACYVVDLKSVKRTV